MIIDKLKRSIRKILNISKSKDTNIDLVIQDKNHKPKHIDYIIELNSIRDKKEVIRQHYNNVTDKEEIDRTIREMGKLEDKENTLLGLMYGKQKKGV